MRRKDIERTDKFLYPPMGEWEDSTVAPWEFQSCCLLHEERKCPRCKKTFLSLWYVGGCRDHEGLDETDKAGEKDGRRRLHH